MESQLLKFKEGQEREKEEVSRGDTIVFKGFEISWGEQAAINWIMQQLWGASGIEAIYIFVKGDFSGVVFAKLRSKEERDSVILHFRKIKLMYFGSKIRVDVDLQGISPGKCDYRQAVKIAETIAVEKNHLFLSEGFRVEPDIINQA